MPPRTPKREREEDVESADEASLSQERPAKKPKDAPAPLEDKIGWRIRGSPTRFAKLYGGAIKIRHGQERLLKHTGRSGLTPLSPYTAKEYPHLPRWREFKAKLHDYQKKRLAGFTSAEIHLMEALAGTIDTPMVSRLDNPLHPLFEKNRWFNDGNLPRNTGFVLGAPGGGLWEANNPAVWELLLPSLRLASLLMYKSELWSWWDALLHEDDFLLIKETADEPVVETEVSRVEADAESDIEADDGNSTRMEGIEYGAARKEPEEKRIPLKDQKWNFFARSIVLREAEKEEVQAKLLRLCEKITFNLYSGYCEGSFTGLRCHNYMTDAVMEAAIHRDCAQICISVERVQSLLRTDITDAERMLVRFDLTSSIIHEIAHAVWHNMRQENKKRKYIAIEPFFECEPLSELGFSLEKHIWGDCIDYLLKPFEWPGEVGQLGFGIIRQNWQNLINKGYDNGENWNQNYISSDPKDPFWNDTTWPIPVSWINDLFQPSYWQGPVAQFGIRAVQAGPLTLGIRSSLRTFDRERLTDYDKQFWLSKVPASATTGASPGSDMNRFYASRRTQALRIHTALENFHQLHTEPGNPFEWDAPYVPMSPARSPLEQPRVLDRPQPSCPRWGEIFSHMVVKRGPEELALETMNFPISEPAFYRTLLATGLRISQDEFHGFLATANQKGELFKWDERPPGTVEKIANAWPVLRPVAFKHRPVACRYMIFYKTMMLEEVKGFMWRRYDGHRDIDCESMRLIVNYFLPKVKFTTSRAPFDAAEFYNAVNYWAWEEGCLPCENIPIKFLTHGPKFCVRLHPDYWSERPAWMPDTLQSVANSTKE